MSQFKPKSYKKSVSIVLLSVFSFLLFISVGGFFNKLAQGESEISEYIPNIVLFPVSSFFVIRSILVLKGKIRSVQVIWRLILDVALIAMLVFCDLGAISLFIHCVSDGQIMSMIFSVLLFAGFIWAIYMQIKISKLRWILASFAFVPNKNAEKRRNSIINALMSVEQLSYITDYTVNSKIPYVADDGAIYIYDSRELAAKERDRLGFNMKIASYIVNANDKNDRKEWLENIFDIGLETIQYETSFGSIDLPLEEFALIKSDDPVHNYSKEFLRQNYVSLLRTARLVHLNEVERPETERSEAFSIAAAQRKTAAKKFYDSVFYTIVLPNNIVGNNVLSFSKCAYNVLGNNEAANAFFDKMNCKMLCLDTAPTPHIDRNSDNEPFIMTFTKLERAKEYLDYTRRLLADFEANTEEEKNKCAESICRLREISCCEICAMTGKEIAENTVNSNYEFVLINNSQSLLYRSIEMCVAEE